MVFKSCAKTATETMKTNKKEKYFFSCIPTIFAKIEVRDRKVQCYLNVMDLKRKTLILLHQNKIQWMYLKNW
jgi:hypothetical protein